MGKVRRMYADAKYHNFRLYEWVGANASWDLSIVRRPEGKEGWVLLPIRWTVERTFAWLGRCRRLSKDRERGVLSSEAFIKLAEAGLVQIRPQRGTMITPISTEAVMDARFVREAIEADVVKLVAERSDQAIRTELLRQIEEQKRVADDDSDGFVKLDEFFHRTLAEMAGKAYAWRVVEDVKAQMDRVRYLSVRKPHVRLLISQHEAIWQLPVRQTHETSVPQCRLSRPGIAPSSAMTAMRLSAVRVAEVSRSAEG